MPSFSNNVLGKIVLNTKGEILKSGGDLQNDEHIAKIVFNLLNLIRSQGQQQEEAQVERLSLHYRDHAYVVSLISGQIQINKLKRDPPSENYLHED